MPAMEFPLPVIDLCDDCGACCMEQESPPGYVMLLSSPEMMAEETFREDAERISAMPSALQDELRNYLHQLLAGVERPDTACIWLDKSTMRCRHHEHRPSVCRDFEIGTDECRSWREAYGIDQ
jgi:uncharacterized protein